MRSRQAPIADLTSSHRGHLLGHGNRQRHGLYGRDLGHDGTWRGLASGHHRCLSPPAWPPCRAATQAHSFVRPLEDRTAAVNARNLCSQNRLLTIE